MPFDSQITEILTEAVRELNSISAPEFRLDPRPESVLSKSHGGTLDSLGLVNLVVITEQKLASAAGVKVSLSSADTFAALNNEIHTFRDFVNYLGERTLPRRDGSPSQ